MLCRFLGLRLQPERLPLTCTMATLVALMAGCATAPRAAPSPPAAPPVAAPNPGASPPSPATHTNVPDIPEGATLTVAQVVQRAIDQNPDREVFVATRATALAQIRVAQTWANPEVELSGGRATARDGGARETILGVELRQRFEWPGKRSGRIAAARVGQGVVDGEVAIDVLALETAVREACAALVAAEAVLALAQAQAAATEQMATTVALRSAAQEAEPGEAARARLDEITARSARERAARQVLASRAAVRAWAGGGMPELFTIGDGLPAALPIVERAAAVAVAVGTNPRLALLRAQSEVRGAELTREQRAWQPDITLGAFSRRESDTDDNGLILGVELPLWNRNQGGIAVAEAERRTAVAQMRAEQRRIVREVDLAWQVYESRRLALGPALAEASAAAQTAVEARLAAFAAGEATLLDVLEARRAARAVAETTLEARRAAADAWLALGRAMGSFTIPPNAPAGVQP